MKLKFNHVVIGRRPKQDDFPLSLVEDGSALLPSLNLDGLFLEVKDTDGRWLPTVILDEKEGKVLVHYIGWSDKWNEWISKDNSTRVRNYKSLSELISRIKESNRSDARASQNTEVEKYLTFLEKNSIVYSR